MLGEVCVRERASLPRTNHPQKIETTLAVLLVMKLEAAAPQRLADGSMNPPARAGANRQGICIVDARGSDRMAARDAHGQLSVSHELRRDPAVDHTFTHRDAEGVVTEI